MIVDKITEYLHAHRDEIVARLSALCAIPSVEGVPSEGKPFGEEVDRALSAAAAMFSEEGFPVERDPEGRFVLASYGEGEHTVGIFAHADVVPAGNGWTVTEPFSPIVHEGCLIARGVRDNKDGIVGALYMLKALRELGIPTGVRFLVFIGGNEETGMHDVDAFLAAHGAPDASLVPDNDFPMSLGEKGRAKGYLVSPPLLFDVLDFSGGTAYNVVLDRAAVKLAYSDALFSSLTRLSEGREDITLTAEPEAGRILLEARGRAAHAAHPHGSRNAAGVAAELLASCEVLSSDERGVLAAAALFLSDPFGGPLGIAGTDGPFGRRTAVTGMVRVHDGRLFLSEDIRYGAPTTFAELAPLIEEAVDGEEWEMNLSSEGDGFDLGDDDPLARALLDTYRALTNEAEAVPYRSGGGTYARHLPRAFSHGLTLHSLSPDFAGMLGKGHGDVHSPDECQPIDAYLAGIRVFVGFAQAVSEFLCDE